jgi:hypothetical protein
MCVHMCSGMCVCKYIHVYIDGSAGCEHVCTCVCRVRYVRVDVCECLWNVSEMNTSQAWGSAIPGFHSLLDDCE